VDCLNATEWEGEVERKRRLREPLAGSAVAAYLRHSPQLLLFKAPRGLTASRRFMFPSSASARAA
jgi:hypothetical protein